MNKVPFELELKRRGCRWQSHRPSIHLCVWLAWALTLFQGPLTSVQRERGPGFPRPAEAENFEPFFLGGCQEADAKRRTEAEEEEEEEEE